MNADVFAGAWRGHYEQDGARYGVTMRLEQTGDRVRGTMRDLQTMMLGAVEPEQAAELRQLIEVEGDAEFDYVVSMPSDSTIEGTVDGTTLSFVKRYQGTQRNTFWTKGAQIDIDFPQHSVRYRGRLARDGSAIRGVWWIGTASPTDTDADRGTFELAREPTASGSP